MYSQCRDCGAEIAWFITRSGKNIPIDADSFEEDDPNIEWVEGEDWNGNVEERPLFDRFMGYSVHFDTCAAKTREERSTSRKNGGRDKQRGKKAKKQSSSPPEYEYAKPPPTNDGKWTDDKAYASLHLRRDAPKSVVKAAYRALSILYHPDHNPNSEEEMKLINGAYEHLVEQGLAD